MAAATDDGQDGQQLLEDLRHHQLIGLLTIFIMITSEGVYSKVVSAAELTPTDYILKPFTVDVLSARIARAIERRGAFLPAYQLIGQGNLREAIRLCALAEAAHPRYALDFARLRAELHVSLKELGRGRGAVRARSSPPSRSAGPAWAWRARCSRRSASTKPKRCWPSWWPTIRS